jgi:4-hydroxyphenylpyruvate dioxygenase-like putative hemolysin
MIELIERRNYEGFSDENVQALFKSLEERNLY